MEDRTIKIGDKVYGVDIDPQTLEKKNYRKIPLVITAIKIDEPFTVDTLEGLMSGKAGDYLVFGIKGEAYPVDADIFEATYELVEKVDDSEVERPEVPEVNLSQ